MSYQELQVLIPSHSLEDFPTEANEKQANSLLNAFASIWHPVLLQSAQRLPGWWRADDPPDSLENKLFFVPTVADSWLKKGWVEMARKGGAKVVTGCEHREEYTRAALEGFAPAEQLDPELVRDFQALGICRLFLELLTRRMHYYADINEDVLERATLSAASAAIGGNRDQAREHLTTAFETLTNGRTQIQSVDCYFLDLCLLIPRLADEQFVAALDSPVPLNILVSAGELAEITEKSPAAMEKCRQRLEAGTLSLIGGDRRDIPVPLVPLESLLWELQQGLKLFDQQLGHRPRCWGKRRFGLTSQMPQILKKSGFKSALHVVLDDGIYPDREESKMHWEGCDGSVIDALARLPFAADSASGFLKFAERLAETTQQDYVAALTFARWPELRTPYLQDLQRAQRYSPVFGKFVSLEEFTRHAESSGHYHHHMEDEYFSPFFVHAVARREPDPVSRFAGHFQRRQQLETALWLRNVTRILQGQAPAEDQVESLIETVERGNPDGSPEEVAAARQTVEDFSRDMAGAMQSFLLPDNNPGKSQGHLIINPLPFSRRVSLELPELQSVELNTTVKSAQLEGERKLVTLELPPAGYVWLPLQSDNPSPPPRKPVPLAEEFLLQNEQFEVNLNPQTGGIARIKNHGRSPNRLSQQLAYRFAHERTFRRGEGEQVEEVKTFYSEMRLESAEVTSTGPALGEIVTRGFIVNQVNNAEIARFVQTMRIWRGRPVLEIDIELEPLEQPDGDPWSNYYCARFAWNDSTAALTRSVLLGAHGFRGERIESPHYLEIAETDPDQRTTILSHGRCFHRKTAPRMLDSILLAAGETQRTFRFTIALDQDYPMLAAREAEIPPVVSPVLSGPPPFGPQGWFFHLSAKSVQLTRIMDLMPEPARPVSEFQPSPPDGDSFLPPKGFAVRLVETEGRNRTVKLTCFRTPLMARQRDFTGKTLASLRIDGDAVLLDLAPYEIADVELRYE